MECFGVGDGVFFKQIWNYISKRRAQISLKQLNDITHLGLSKLQKKKQRNEGIE